MKLTIGILGFDEMEALDFVGPYEVFTTASRVSVREGFPIQFNVIAIADQPSFTARAGLTFATDCHFRFSPDLCNPRYPIPKDVCLGGKTSLF